ncbi:MAG: hypothetical protein AB7N54_02910 [Alphaproteobacteria bacterium]
MMSRWLPALLLPVLALAHAGEATAQARLYAGPEAGVLYEESGPRLITVLFPTFRLGLRSSSGGPQTLRQVLESPEAIGFVQKDVLRDHLARRPGDIGRLQSFGNVGLRCVYAAVRKGGWVASFEDLLRPRDDRPIKVDIGEAEGDTAATFDAMRRLEPRLASVSLDRRGGMRALYMVEAGLTDVALFVEEPSLDSPAITRVVESESLTFLPVAARSLLATDADGDSSYQFTRVVVDRNPWLRSETAYETLCTPVGVVVNAAGNEAFLDAVAYASINGDLVPREPPLVDRVLRQAEAARDALVDLLRRL